MAFPEVHVSEIASVIQLSVAPVFLLTGVAGLVAALTQRVSRIVDRARDIEEELVTAPPEIAKSIHEELRTLGHRASLVGLALALAVGSGLLVTLTIAVAFMDAFMGLDLSYAILGMFIAALFAVSGALLVFLREVLLATASLRFGPR